MDSLAYKNSFCNFDDIIPEKSDPGNSVILQRPEEIHKVQNVGTLPVALNLRMVLSLQMTEERIIFPAYLQYQAS